MTRRNWIWVADSSKKTTEQPHRFLVKCAKKNVLVAMNKGQKSKLKWCPNQESNLWPWGSQKTEPTTRLGTNYCYEVNLHCSRIIEWNEFFAYNIPIKISNDFKTAVLCIVGQILGPFSSLIHYIFFRYQVNQENTLWRFKPPFLKNDHK